MPKRATKPEPENELEKKPVELTFNMVLIGDEILCGNLDSNLRGTTWKVLNRFPSLRKVQLQQLKVPSADTREMNEFEFDQGKFVLVK